FPVDQFTPGFDYSFKIVRFRNPKCAASSIYVKLSWIHDYVTYPPNQKAGTLRVKSITLNDANGNSQIKRSYNYKEFNNPTFSSGKFSGRSTNPVYISSSPITIGQGGSQTNLNIS